ncbi:MAG: ABC transporter permease [Gemmatimonadota bacterium]
MSWLSEARSTVAAIFRRRRQEAELEEELQHHIGMEALYNRRAGRPDAEDIARRAFGNMELHKDQVRDERGARWFENLRQDIRIALRSLGRRPAFTALVVASLGVGIGATAALFLVVKTVLLTPLPYGRPEGIAVVWSAWRGFDQTWLSYDEYEAWDSGIRSFADVGIFTDGSLTFTDGDSPERVRSASVGANVFQVLGAQPIIGRSFTADEDRPDGPAAVILGHGVWQRRYGGDHTIVGRTVEVNGDAATVVGVMPPDFRLPIDFAGAGRSEAWIPLATDAAANGAIPGPAISPGGGSHGYYGVARLARGATIEGANRELEAFVAQKVREGVFPVEQQFRAFAVSVTNEVTGAVRPVLLLVFGAVAFVLLIACANVSGLLLVRGEARRREMAVRVALGAGSSRLAGLLLTESAVLSVFGGLAGIALAAVTIPLLRRLAPSGLPRVAETQIEPTLLIVALLATTFVAFVIGVLPALQASRVTPAVELREGGRGATAGGERVRWRQMLVTVEVALAVILVAGAGLMIRSVGNLFAIAPGFDPARVLTMRITTPATWYGDSAQVASFWTDVQSRVAGLPGVASAGAVRLLPLADEMGDWGLQVEGYTPPPNQGTPGDWQIVTPGYFETMRLQLRAGRFLGQQDDLAGSLSMVVNKTFVDRYLANRAPLGARVRIGGSDSTAFYTIVGVVDDVRQNSLTREVKAQFYVTLAHFAQAPGNLRRTMHLVVRADANPRSLLGPIRQVVRDVDPRLPVSDVRTMEEIYGSAIAEQRFAMQLLSLFGLLALMLSAVGVFGIVSQVVMARTQEFGIRTALGATPGRIVLMSLQTGQLQILAGLAIGTGAALLLTRFLSSLLHGVAPSDPATFVTVIIVTGSIALLASIAPARRAARTNPAVVLHEG